MRYFVDSTPCLDGCSVDKGGCGPLGFLNTQQQCRYGSRLIGSISSHCQAWWKPNTAVSNFINIVAGGTCWTCLLSALQMVGNVPDLLTPLGASAAGAPQPMQPIPMTPLCVCMNVHLWLSVYINCHMATWVFLYPSLFFSSATHRGPPYVLLYSSLPFIRNSQAECAALRLWSNSLTTVWEKKGLVQSVQPHFPLSLYGDALSPLCLCSRVDKSHDHLQ